MHAVGDFCTGSKRSTSRSGASCRRRGPGRTRSLPLLQPWVEMRGGATERSSVQSGWGLRTPSMSSTVGRSQQVGQQAGKD